MAALHGTPKLALLVVVEGVLRQQLVACQGGGGASLLTLTADVGAWGVNGGGVTGELGTRESEKDIRC